MTAAVIEYQQCIASFSPRCHTIPFLGFLDARQPPLYHAAHRVARNYADITRFRAGLHFLGL